MTYLRATFITLCPVAGLIGRIAWFVFALASSDVPIGGAEAQGFGIFALMLVQVLIGVCVLFPVSAMIKSRAQGWSLRSWTHKVFLLCALCSLGLCGMALMLLGGADLVSLIVLWSLVFPFSIILLAPFSWLWLWLARRST